MDLHHEVQATLLVGDNPDGALVDGHIQHDKQIRGEPALVGVVDRQTAADVDAAPPLVKVPVQRVLGGTHGVDVPVALGGQSLVVGHRAQARPKRLAAFFGQGVPLRLAGGPGRLGGVRFRDGGHAP